MPVPEDWSFNQSVSRMAERAFDAVGLDTGPVRLKRVTRSYKFGFLSKYEVGLKRLPGGAPYIRHIACRLKAGSASHR